MKKIFLSLLFFCIVTFNCGFCAESSAGSAVSNVKNTAEGAKSAVSSTSKSVSAASISAAKDAKATDKDRDAVNKKIGKKDGPTAVFVSSKNKDTDTCRQDKNYVIQKLQTGQTVVIMPVRTNPIVTIDTWIKTGSINENDKNSGTAHFLEHLFFKGTEKTPPGEFDRILESKGGVTNAATSKDFTHYYITIPSKEFDKALELHADMLLNPLIPRKELEKERLVVLEEISRGQDNPKSVMYNNLFKLIYTQNNPPHPYFRPVIGSNKVIETISRDEILDFYNKWYSPHNMTTVIVGDVDPDYALKRVAELFVDNNKTYMEGVYPKVPDIQKKIRVQEEKDVNTGYMSIAYKAPKFKDDKDSYALDVLATILGESRSSVLNKKLREQKQLVHSIAASNSSFMDDGLFIIQASFKPENLNIVENEIFKAIENIKNNRGDDIIDDAQISRAINMIKTSTYYSRESISNISNELGYMTLLGGDTRYYDNYLNNIENVKKADVIRVAKKYLNNDKTAISVIMPKNIKKTMGEDNNTKEVSNVQNTDYISAAKKIESAEGVDKYVLSNGATLIIKKNPINSIIAFDIEAAGGNHLEKLPGTASVAASAVSRGTKKMDSEEYANFLDERGIKISFNPGSDVFCINMLTTTNELDSALMMLHDVVNEPLFANSEVEKVKKLRLAAIKESKDNALNLGVNKFRSIAFKGSVYGVDYDTVEKNLPNVTREDALNFYNSVLDPENMVITVVGNVENDKIINEMSKIFKPKSEGCKITVKEIAENGAKEAYQPIKNIEETVIKKDTKTAWVLVGYKTDGIYNMKDIATLKVINAILGEGMSSRLFKNLRDKQGLAYSVGSSILQNVSDGAFIAYIGTNDRSIEKSKTGMLNEINRLKNEYVSNIELKEAKDKIMGNILISLETNMDDASLLGWYGILGYDLNHLEEYKKEIMNVTQSDILAAANKYFSKPYINVTVKDEAK